jgi:hypothetical protein
MRDHTLTGWHTQRLRQRFVVRADNFFIDEADQLHRNCDQRTYLGHLRPLSSARRAVCSAGGPQAFSLIWPPAYPDSVPAVTRRHPSPARSRGIETNTEEMTVSEEREMAVRKEMAVMHEEGVTCEGMAVEGARVPAAVPATAGKAATAPVPSGTAAKSAPATMHSHSGRAYAECRNGR